MKWQENLLRKNKLDFRVGDIIKVNVKVREADKERIQVFEGTVLGKKGAGLDATFKVRKMSAGVGVEKIFLVNSPWIESVKVVKKGDVRRAKLYYLRGKVGKGLKIKERIDNTEQAIDAAPTEAKQASADEKK
jgi:large subunit ribosomal protein L19